MKKNYQNTYDSILSKIRDRYEDVSLNELKQLSEILCHRYTGSDLILKQLSNEELTRNSDYLLRSYSELVKYKRTWGSGSKHYILNNLYKSSYGLTSESRKKIFIEKQLVIEQDNIGFGNRSGFANFKFFIREHTPYLLLVHEYGYNTITNKIEELVNNIECEFLQDVGFDVIEDEVQIYYKDTGNCYEQVTFELGLKNPKWRSLEITEQLWFDQTWDSLSNVEDLTGKNAYFFEKGKQFDGYQAIRSIFVKVKNELFIVDNYIDSSVFIMLNELVDPNVRIKVLTSFGKLKGDAPILAEKFKAQRTNFSISNAKDIHDRYIFADDDCYLLGASIKDFANKATTLVAITEKPVISSMKKYANKLFADNFSSNTINN